MYTVTVDKKTRKSFKSRSEKIWASKTKHVILSIKWILQKIQKGAIIIINSLLILF
jgi:hypothetical protein